MKMTATPTPATPAVPAFTRGLSVMRLLADRGPLAMEAVATSLSLPHSSAFRLLETLRTLGYAERDPARRYRLVWSFGPGEDASAAFTARLVASMERLADALGVTIEWYEPSDRGMELRRQCRPSHAEVRVFARPGFVRTWNTELDAVARLGHAFAPRAPALKAGVHVGVRDGHTARIALREARALLAAARRRDTATDTIFNTNGVRRAAAVVRSPGGEFAGILAAAACISFDPKAPTPVRIVAALRDLSSELSR